jgi:tetratricopeptide (TPR) repeat protein
MSSHSLSLTQQFTNVHYNRAIIFSELGSYEKAISNFNKAIELEETFAPAYYERGLVYHKLGQVDQARHDWQQYLLLKPDGPDKDLVLNLLREL